MEVSFTNTVQTLWVYTKSNLEKEMVGISKEYQKFNQEGAHRIYFHNCEQASTAQSGNLGMWNCRCGQKCLIHWHTGAGEGTWSKKAGGYRYRPRCSMEGRLRGWALEAVTGTQSATPFSASFPNKSYSVWEQAPGLPEGLGCRISSITKSSLFKDKRTEGSCIPYSDSWNDGGGEKGKEK